MAAGINHFNQAQIILKLLATGRNTLPEHRAEEGALIAAALSSLPPQRAWRVLEEVRQRHINNRRSRAIARDYLNERHNLSFDAVKYRSKVRAIAAHAHLKLQGELGTFLFCNWKQQVYKTGLFEKFRQAHYDARAIYELPFTIAEGLAAKHNVPREVFLSRIEQQMTKGEKLCLRGVAEHTGIEINVDLGRLPLTRLTLYILSLPLETRQKQWDTLNQALEQSARLALQKAPPKLGEQVATDLLPVRPHRSEPRVVKRKPKPFPRMRQPRPILNAKLVA